METTFISIHDLTPNARILYSSDSVIDILGYTPDEIVNHSAWDFFHKDELPYAKKFHERKVNMDNAAVLAYCSVKTKKGDWVGCECCFTIVYDVMIVCTSIYQRGGKAEGRALAAPIVRRMFANSPKDPRYHMLSHISAKFTQPSKAQIHEPRAALFLNRFTRTLTIMYATNGLEEIIGIPAEAMRGRSFYYCIAENCLQDAVKCLENAKGNDSIAYLRFWFRDPRIDDPAPDPIDDSDDEMTTEMSEDMSEGGVGLVRHDGSSAGSSHSNNSNAIDMDLDDSDEYRDPNSRTSSGDSTRASDTHEAIFGHARESDSSTSSAVPSPERQNAFPARATIDPIELEAVISCASDGLVVCLRRARPMIPHPAHRPSKPMYANGMFAAPWAAQPVLPPLEARPRAGFGTGFAPSLGPMGARHDSPQRAGGPESHDFMAAIRDQAIFAWALTGINGTLADVSLGQPVGSATPVDGFPVWASDARNRANAANAESNGSGKMEGSAGVSAERGWQTRLFGDPGLARVNVNGAGGGYGNGNGNGNGNGYGQGGYFR
ncbi:hypothetical protein B0A48_12236 [Cryoendolithus antarcticus]|uniref:PAS domain-containing protein n=1 Tax=Cryoendolithus antarcticus TaxID=1507870 RepID=A0A1V8SU41_9PEZI|nr:hypothetical protein B0A48_12236 [Cryoendolithus antarcticus]